MFLIALLFILYTSVSYWAIERLFAASSPGRLRRGVPNERVDPPSDSRVRLSKAYGAAITTAPAVTRACLDRIAALEPGVRAFAHLDPAAALAAAERVEQSRA